MDLADRLRASIVDVPDFPQPGIVFKDITPVLLDGALLRAVIESFSERCRALGIEKIAGMDARGFLFGPGVACELGIGFVPLRKHGKLPRARHSESFSLEYGTAKLEMHQDAVRPGERVALIDDLLATGGTAAAASRLIERAGGVAAEFLFVIELGFLGGRRLLEPAPVHSLVNYP